LLLIWIDHLDRFALLVLRRFASWFHPHRPLNQILQLLLHSQTQHAPARTPKTSSSRSGHWSLPPLCSGQALTFNTHLRLPPELCTTAKSSPASCLHATELRNPARTHALAALAKTASCHRLAAFPRLEVSRLQEPKANKPRTKSHRVAQVRLLWCPHKVPVRDWHFLALVGRFAEKLQQNLEALVTRSLPTSTDPCLWIARPPRNHSCRR
jgi:hypothetical protein